MQVFRDREIKWFYGIILSLAAIPLLLTVTVDEKEWGAFATVVTIMAGFMYFGWPLKATITPENDIVFQSPLRHARINAQSLRRVKSAGAHDYRAHIVLRAKWSLPIGYRCRQYENAPILAQAVLALINEAPDALATDDAIKLLNKVAKGKTTPLKK